MNRRSFITTVAALIAAPAIAKYVPRMWATGGLLPKGYPLIVGELGPEIWWMSIDPALIANEIVAGTLAVGTIRVDQLIPHTIIRTDHLHLSNLNRQQTQTNE